MDTMCKLNAADAPRHHHIVENNLDAWAILQDINGGHRVASHHDVISDISE
jgi:hypothetical protein